MEIDTTVYSESGIDKEEWDTLVASAHTGNLSQTTLRARYDRLAFKSQPFYLKATSQNGDVIGLLLFFVSGLHHRWFARRRFSSLGLALSKRILPIGYFYEGPVILDKANEEAILLAILRALDFFARQRKVIEIWGYYPFTSDLSCETIKRAFGQYGFEPGPRWVTFHVDLTRSEEELWENLKKDARNKVRRYEKQGVQIFEDSTNHGLQNFHRAYTELANRNTLGLPWPLWLKSLYWEIFKSTLSSFWLSMKAIWWLWLRFMSIRIESLGGMRNKLTTVFIII